MQQHLFLFGNVSFISLCIALLCWHFHDSTTYMIYCSTVLILALQQITKIYNQVKIHTNPNFSNIKRRRILTAKGGFFKRVFKMQKKRDWAKLIFYSLFFLEYIKNVLLHNNKNQNMMIYIFFITHCWCTRLNMKKMMEENRRENYNWIVTNL